MSDSFILFLPRTHTQKYTSTPSDRLFSGTRASLCGMNGGSERVSNVTRTTYMMDEPCISYLFLCNKLSPNLK